MLRNPSSSTYSWSIRNLWQIIILQILLFIIKIIVSITELFTVGTGLIEVLVADSDVVRSQIFEDCFVYIVGITLEEKRWWLGLDAVLGKAVLVEIGYS